MKTYQVAVDGQTTAVSVEATSDGLRVFVPPAGLDLAPRETVAPAREGASPSSHRIDLAEVLPGWYSLLIDGRSHDLRVATWRGTREAGLGAPRRWTLILDGHVVTAEVGRVGRSRGRAPAASAAAGQIRAPMPGLVVALHVEPGMPVASGQPLVIMEAMKMQMEIRAPHAGTVREIRVAAGQDVAGDELLVTVE